MAFETTETTRAIADGILVWCGVTSPTPAEFAVAELAAMSAEATIKHYRGLAVDDDFEMAYLPLAVRMGSYDYQKRGVDGVTSYSENGVQRSYEKGSYPPSMLAEITLVTGSG